MVEIQHKTDLKGQEQPLAPALKDQPLGLTLIMGGTNIRWTLNSVKYDELLSSSMSWLDCAEVLKVTQSQLRNEQHRTLELIAEKIINYLRENGLEFSQIKNIGISIAGHVQEDRNNTALVSTVNTGVYFNKFPIAEEFSKALISVAARVESIVVDPSITKDIQVINDGHAAVLGEVLIPDGSLFMKKNGIFLIIGTGIGGGGITNNHLDFDITELGHTVLYRSDGKYQYQSIVDLINADLYVDGNYQTPPQENTYLENLIAGPWIAIRFIKSLGDNPAEIQKLIDCINDGSIGEAPKKKLTMSDIHNIEALNAQQRMNWALKIPSTAIKTINRFIFSVTPEIFGMSYRDMNALTSALADDRLSMIIKKTFDYKMGTLRSIGEAVGAIGAIFHSHALVLGGGVIEALNAGKDVEFSHTIIRKYSRIENADERIMFSTCSAEMRESAFVTSRLRQILSEEAKDE